MTRKPDPNNNEALLLLGCPEVPVQMGIAIYAAHQLTKQGMDVAVAGNEAVIKLLRVSDPDRLYVKRVLNLDRTIGELAEKKRDPGLCIVFAHNDAGISYAATAAYIIKGRLIVIVFGREAEKYAGQIEFPCETIVEKAVHNPTELKKKIDEVFGWHASRT
jgi:hypothetical protein